MMTRKEKVYNFICDELYVPMRFKEMCFMLQVKDGDKAELLEILNELMDEGKLRRTVKGKYMKQEELMYQGTFMSNKRGFGFVRVDGIKEDFFIPERLTNGAFHDDIVLIRAVKERGQKRVEAVVEKIIDRGIKRLVGIFERSKNFGFVLPDNSKVAYDIFVPMKHSMNAATGQKVVVELVSYGEDGRSPKGKIVEILGRLDDPATDVLTVVKSLDIPTEFPDDVRAYVKRLPDAIDSKDIAGRVDLRELQTVTIDGEDAKDLDDAITLSKDGDIYHLGVHIADVSHYVSEGSPLDREALKRGTSCYLVDKVIPMLPEKLSNGLCSLNAGVDRLTLSCLMDIDAKGHVVNHRICESVINVDKRMSYTDVSAIIEDGDEAVTAKYENLVPMFFLMKELSAILRAVREKRGSIDFDFEESKIHVDAQGEVEHIAPYARRLSNMIIEDFMLAANETIAEDFFWQQVPFEYRIHEAPDEERVKNLAELIARFGFFFKASKENIHPKEFQKLLAKIAGEPCENLISRMTLRTMRQARYSTECEGHFGLSCKYYCHFTSPIRRYPDLQIHRIIKDNIHGRLDAKRIAHYEAILPKVCDDNSKKERRAEDAERQVEKLKKVEYMARHIGEQYEGIISGVINKGFFVELPNTVEGFVDVGTLYDDFYVYLPDEYAMMGSDTGRRYAIGDTVKVKVVGADKLTKTIDFKVVKEHAKGKRKQAYSK